MAQGHYKKQTLPHFPYRHIFPVMAPWFAAILGVSLRDAALQDSKVSPVCFQSSGCMDLTTIVATTTQRRLLNATCDPRSSYQFSWPFVGSSCKFEKGDWKRVLSPIAIALFGTSGFEQFFDRNEKMRTVGMQRAFSVSQALATDNVLSSFYEMSLAFISSGLNF